MAIRKKRTLVVIAMTISLIFASALSTSTPVHASLVAFKFSGVVSNLTDVFLASPGTPFSGTYSLESTTSDPASGSRQYELSGLSVTILGNTYDSVDFGGGNGFGQMRVNVPSNGVNSYSVENHIESPLLGPQIDGFRPNQLSIGLEGPNLFSDDALLPQTPPSLGNLLTNRVTFGFINVSSFEHAHVQGALTSLAPVPLPGALLLFGSGLIGLMGLKTLRRLTA